MQLNWYMCEYVSKKQTKMECYQQSVWGLSCWQTCGWSSNKHMCTLSTINSKLEPTRLQMLILPKENLV